MTKASEIIFSATGPWPCPKEIDLTLFNTPMSAANLWKDPNGSDPVLKTNTSGTVLEMSLYLKIKYINLKKSIYLNKLKMLWYGNQLNALVGTLTNTL